MDTAGFQLEKRSRSAVDYYTDHITGELIACQVFVACLPYSDYSFAIAVPSQRIADFLYASECYLQHIGGTHQILVPDNLKSAIIRTDRHEPDMNSSLEDFANHYNITVISTRAIEAQILNFVQ